jgi:hypothetical protein
MLQHAPLRSKRSDVALENPRAFRSFGQTKVLVHEDVARDAKLVAGPLGAKCPIEEFDADVPAALVEPADAAQYFRAHEEAKTVQALRGRGLFRVGLGGGLGQCIKSRDVLVIAIGNALRTVGVVGQRADHADLRITFANGEQEREPTLGDDAAAVEKNDVFALGERQSEIAQSREPPSALAQHEIDVGVCRAPCLQELDGSVGRAVVDDHDAVARNRVFDDAHETALDLFQGVARGDDNRRLRIAPDREALAGQDRPELAIDDARAVVISDECTPHTGKRSPGGLVFVQGDDGIGHGRRLVGHDERRLSTSFRHSLGADRRGHHRKPRGQRFADLSLHAGPIAEGRHRKPVGGEQRSGRGYVTGDGDLRARQRLHLGGRTSAGDGQGDVWSFCVHQRQHVTTEVEHRVDVGLVQEIADE